MGENVVKMWYGMVQKTTIARKRRFGIFWRNSRVGDFVEAKDKEIECLQMGSSWSFNGITSRNGMFMMFMGFHQPQNGDLTNEEWIFLCVSENGVNPPVLAISNGYNDYDITNGCRGFNKFTNSGFFDGDMMTIPIF